MWHLLARSGLSESPRKQVMVELIHSVLRTSCSIEVNQLTQYKKGGGGVTPGYESRRCSHAGKGEFWVDIGQHVDDEVNASK